MKAASRELNLTVITLIAIAAISGFFLTFFWPTIINTVNQQWNTIEKSS